MSDFLAYPIKFDDLFLHDTFFLVLLKAVQRLRQRTSIDFRLDNDRAEKLFSEWSELIKGRVARSAEFLSSLEAVDKVTFWLQVLERSTASMCGLMCLWNVVEDVRLFQDANKTWRSNYEAIRSYPSEYFSLYVCYNCYRNYASRATGKLAQDWFAGRDFEEVVRICILLRDRPLETGGVFSQIIVR